MIEVERQDYFEKILEEIDKQGPFGQVTLFSDTLSFRSNTFSKRVTSELMCEGYMSHYDYHSGQDTVTISWNAFDENKPIVSKKGDN
ncbi:hypothetical protein CYANOKiyG1_27570 [Okeania sp. KiyG1]|nr:hypothetical protein CYANOKiyG1_27570 [Okeania sp. KiyG1]